MNRDSDELETHLPDRHNERSCFLTRAAEKSDLARGTLSYRNGIAVFVVRPVSRALTVGLHNNASHCPNSMTTQPLCFLGCSSTLCLECTKSCRGYPRKI